MVKVDSKVSGKFLPALKPGLFDQERRPDLLAYLFFLFPNSAFFVTHNFLRIISIRYLPYFRCSYRHLHNCLGSDFSVLVHGDSWTQGGQYSSPWPGRVGTRELEGGQPLPTPLHTCPHLVRMAYRFFIISRMHGRRSRLWAFQLTWATCTSKQDVSMGLQKGLSHGGHAW